MNSTAQSRINVLDMFLKANKIYSKFYKYGDFHHIERRGRASFEEYITERFFGGEGLFSCAFAWAETPEGYNFWADVNSRWCEFVRDFQNC